MSIQKKRQVDEILRCRRDPLYFFKTYARVSHPIKGPVPFETYPFQDDCVRAFLENRFVIVNKSRQLGLSTLAAAYSACPSGLSYPGWQRITRRRSSSESRRTHA